MASENNMLLCLNKTEIFPLHIFVSERFLGNNAYWTEKITLENF